MPHFFINSEKKSGNRIIIDDKENYTHLAKALRARIGEKILLIDENRVQYETIISRIDSKTIEVEIEKSYYSERDLEFNLYLAQSPLRSDSQNFVAEKATELGVRSIIPIMTDNCALNCSVIEKKIPRWNKIMYEASKQCERAVIPTCENLSDINTLIQSNRFDRIIAFCERRATLTLKDLCKKNPIKRNECILVIIGPEGGFSNAEFDFFEKNAVPMLTLGNLILKAETAVTVALGNIIYEFENYRQN